MSIMVYEIDIRKCPKKNVEFVNLLLYLSKIPAILLYDDSDNWCKRFVLAVG